MSSPLKTASTMVCGDEVHCVLIETVKSDLYSAIFHYLLTLEHDYLAVDSKFARMVMTYHSMRKIRHQFPLSLVEWIHALVKEFEAKGNFLKSSDVKHLINEVSRVGMKPAKNAQDRLARSKLIYKYTNEGILFHEDFSGILQDMASFGSDELAAVFNSRVVIDGVEQSSDGYCADDDVFTQSMRDAYSQIMQLCSESLPAEGGYDKNLFVPSVGVDIVDFCCGICIGVARSPVQCREGHCFCADCLANYKERLGDRRFVCPECRQLIPRCGLSNNTLHQRLVDKMTVRCFGGCKWTGRFDQLNGHVGGAGCGNRLTSWCQVNDWRVYPRDKERLILQPRVGKLLSFTQAFIPCDRLVHNVAFAQALLWPVVPDIRSWLTGGGVNWKVKFDKTDSLSIVRKRFVPVQFIQPGPLTVAHNIHDLFLFQNSNVADEDNVADC